jgi:hypothetical protein
VLVAVHSSNKRASRSGAEREKPEAAYPLIDALAIFTQLLRALQAGVAVVLQELQKIPPTMAQ